MIRYIHYNAKRMETEISRFEPFTVTTMTRMTRMTTMATNKNRIFASIRRTVQYTFIYLLGGLCGFEPSNVAIRFRRRIMVCSVLARLTIK